jgi:hypothetical protein
LNSTTGFCGSTFPASGGGGGLVVVGAATGAGSVLPPHAASMSAQIGIHSFVCIEHLRIGRAAMLIP